MRNSSHILSAFLVFLFLSTSAHANQADAILGRWLTEKGEAVFEIGKTGEKYVGKIVWLQEPTYDDDDKEAGKPVRDREHPDPEKRNQPIVGSCPLNGFEYTADNTWSKGTIYNADNGKTYKATLSLTEDGQLKVHGYIGISLIGGSTHWTRCEKLPEGRAKEAKPGKDQGKREP